MQEGDEDIDEVVWRLRKDMVHRYSQAERSHTWLKHVRSKAAQS